jgi:hypothetical protein
MIMYLLGQLVGCGAVVSLFILFMTEDVRVARACVGYLKASALLVTAAIAVLLVASGLK